MSKWLALLTLIRLMPNRLLAAFGNKRAFIKLIDAVYNREGSTMFVSAIFLVKIVSGSRTMTSSLLRHINLRHRLDSRATQIDKSIQLLKAIESAHVYPEVKQKVREFIKNLENRLILPDCE